MQNLIFVIVKGGTLLARFRRGGLVEICLLSVRLFYFCRNKNLREGVNLHGGGEVGLWWFY
ncbi:hypothetical protein CL630_01315 [bacterium]|nr:hypothetical protein [bacterium]